MQKMTYRLSDVTLSARATIFQQLRGRTSAAGGLRRRGGEERARTGGTGKSRDGGTRGGVEETEEVRRKKTKNALGCDRKGCDDKRERRRSHS